MHGRRVVTNCEKDEKTKHDNQGVRPQELRHKTELLVDLTKTQSIYTEHQESE